MENKDRVKYLKDPKIIGIDPGVNGGIAVYSLSRNKVIEVIKMPETYADLYAILKLYSINSTAVFEKVGSRPGQAGMFTFGKGVGHIEMALYALKIPTDTPTPQTWQKIFNVGVRGKKSEREWKNKLKTKAQQLFPNQKVTLWSADALLIMEYGKRTLNN